MFKIYTRAIILNKNNEVLLMKKNNQQKLGGGKRMQPGGTLEFGEDPEITLIREIKEELDLEVSNLKLFDTKKILINGTHRLGLYYLVKVQSENFTNMEPEKHEEIARVSSEQLPNMLHSDLIKKAMLSDKIGTMSFDVISSSPQTHTMGDALFKYVDIKIHHLIKEKELHHIKILPLYDRSNVIGENEKIGKLFNRKRPTAELEENTLLLSCFPGKDYVQHYAALLKTYFSIHHFSLPIISYILPTKEEILASLLKTNLKNFPQNDIVILGMVEQIASLLPEQVRKGDGDFLWKFGEVNGKKIALLGCKFSFWGDISGYVVDVLAKKGVKKVIYIGKLGGLKQKFLPNQMLATGGESFVNGKKIRWENPFKTINDEIVIHGTHYTSYSIIAEDKKWLNTVKSTFDFVDPEIGHMANNALQNKIEFGYLHIISNILTEEHNENLSNERTIGIKKKRELLFLKIIEYLKSTL